MDLRQPNSRTLRLVFLGMLSAFLLAGCRDSPAELVQKASEAAATHDAVAVRDYFTVTSQRRFTRRWEQQQRAESEGWAELMKNLTFDGKPLEVVGEQIAGDFARVDVKAGADPRDYYLRKEDGRWRLEPGASTRYKKALVALKPAAAKAEASADEAAEADPEARPKKKKKKEK